MAEYCFFISGYNQYEVNEFTVMSIKLREVILYLTISLITIYVKS